MPGKEPGTFATLGLTPDVLAGLNALGFDVPTPIQRRSIPILVEGNDLIGKAETGTGKTLAFLAPIIGRIETQRVAAQALVLCPTRELAQQVEKVAAALGKELGLRTALLVGGVHPGPQILALREGAQIVIGTPGRIIDLLQGRYLNLSWVHHVVLDEGDRMLDMGFIADVMEILSATPKERQTMLFSATIPPRLEQLTHDFMIDPQTVSTSQGTATVEKIRQFYLDLHPYDKSNWLLELLQKHPDDTCIVFCNTRRAVKELDRTLWGLGLPAGALHGDHDQERRYMMLEAFKDRKIHILVATDVAGRGLDIDAVTRVINYDVPEEVDTYVHRIGRTGRAGDEGEAITLVTRKDSRNWANIMSSPRLSVERISWRPERQGAPEKRRREEEDRGRREETRSQRSRPQRSRTQGSRTQGTRSQEPRSQEPRSQGARSQESRSQGTRSQESRSQESRSQESRSQGDRSQESRGQETQEQESGKSSDRPRRRSSKRRSSAPADQTQKTTPAASKKKTAKKKTTKKKSTQRSDGDARGSSKRTAKKKRRTSSEPRVRYMDDPGGSYWNVSDDDPL